MFSQKWKGFFTFLSYGQVYKPYSAMIQTKESQTNDVS